MKKNNLKSLIISRRKSTSNGDWKFIFSHISGVSLLGVPSEVYQYGTQYAVCIFTSFISCFIIVCVYLPVFYKLQLTSTFEYLEIRFARPVRQLASFLYTLALVIYVPLIIYVPALAFSQATGMNLHYVAPVICMVCIFYTTIVSDTNISIIVINFRNARLSVYRRSYPQQTPKGHLGVPRTSLGGLCLYGIWSAPWILWGRNRSKIFLQEECMCFWGPHSMGITSFQVL